MFKVYLSEIKYNQVIKDKSNKDVYYDVYTFLRVESKKIVGKEYQDKWVRKDSDFKNSLPEMIEGNFYYVEIGFNGKISKILPYETEQDFINKYSNNSTTTESNS
uniref:Putative plectrovirus SVGII3 orf c protein n=1 Tax=Spiroplasma citri TaxID=2133 RepID=Q14KW6_SPICI|nr:putative plectrovirus SVGII3 orf c protein [Spiroplasma citri]